MNWLRTRENAAFAKGLMFGKAVGAKDERERIIELLKTHMVSVDAMEQVYCIGCELDYSKLGSFAAYSDDVWFEHFIALIKGENK